MALADKVPEAGSRPRSRSTRDRPAKAPLSVEAVVDAALGILKAEGLEAVTMRRVAAALDTGAASLYVYVAGREGLLAAMLDRVIATVRLEEPDSGRWREQLHSLLGRLHRALVAHPGIAGITLAEPPTTRAVFAFNENLLGILIAGGLEPQEAAWLCDIFVLLVTAVASEDDVRLLRDAANGKRREMAADLQRTFAGLPPERFPLLAAHAAEMVAGDGDERLRFAIDIAVDGVLARHEQR